MAADRLPRHVARAPGRHVPSLPTYEVLTGPGVGARFLRIPFLATTSAGTVLAGCDANYMSTGDSADHIDAVVRRRPAPVADGAAASIDEGWEAPRAIAPLRMRDLADDEPDTQTGASVIVGAILDDPAAGRQLLLIDLWPWNGGIFEHTRIAEDGAVRGGRARACSEHTGFVRADGRSCLLLSRVRRTGDADGKQGNLNLNLDPADFDLAADLDGPRDADGLIAVRALLRGDDGTAHRGEAHLGEPTGYALDDERVLHRHGRTLTVAQKGGAGRVPMRVVYRESELQVLNTQHLSLCVSEDDGRTWRLDRLVTDEMRLPGERCALVGPGRGLRITEGAHAGRLLFPLYSRDAAEGSSTRASCALSDDGGATWRRGEAAPGPLQTTETQLVEAGEDLLLAVHRSPNPSGGAVLVSCSRDGGETWSAPRSALGDREEGVDCMVSAVALPDGAVSPATGRRHRALAIATPGTRARRHGAVHVVAVHDDDPGGGAPRLEPVSTHELTGPDVPFGYSCLTEDADGRLLVMFETTGTDSWAEGLVAMHLAEVPLG
ncbi:exo-alpha-sialidase [Brachybacterium huguangmaarense]